MRDWIGWSWRATALGVLVLAVGPRSRPRTATTSNDLATVVYSGPATTAVLLLIPMGLIVALAFAGRRSAR